MRSWLLFAALTVWTVPVEAQSAHLGRRLASPLENAGMSSDARAATGEQEAPWAGPQIQMSYEFFQLADGWGGGDAHLGGLTVFVQWPVSELRTAVGAGLGSRGYQLGGNDFAWRANAEVGFQLTELLDPLLLHLSVVATVGGIIGERFETTLTHTFGGPGVELGAELRLFRHLHVGLTLGYHRWEMSGAAYDVVLVRGVVGL